MNRQYLSIDVGGTFTKYAKMNDATDILEKGMVPTELSSEEEFVAMLEKIASMFPGVDGVAVCSAGMIDSASGVMHNAGSVTCVHELHLSEILEERLGVPVSVENDARAAACAELWKGSLWDCRNAAVLTLGTAVGGTVILDRKILGGFHGIAGEFSYILTNASDAYNPANTLAMRGGVPALLDMASIRLGIPREKLSGEQLFVMADEGNETALELIRKYARSIAVQVMNLMFILDPERIAVGGGISRQPVLLDLIREEMEKLSSIYPHPVPVPEVTACKYYNDANLIGALYVLMKKYAANPSD
ncbi:MAG: ROK family protein [Bilifractor sp.]|jgi:predicted NBD/HSP70 family sugar kinase